MSRKLPLPVGTTNYKKICEDSYYVDKTLLIKEILDEKVNVALHVQDALARRLTWTCYALFSRKLQRTPADISKIKKFGSREKNIRAIRDNIL